MYGEFPLSPPLGASCLAMTLGEWTVLQHVPTVDLDYDLSIMTMWLVDTIAMDKRRTHLAKAAVSN